MVSNNLCVHIHKPNFSCLPESSMQNQVILKENVTIKLINKKLDHFKSR